MKQTVFNTYISGLLISILSCTKEYDFKTANFISSKVDVNGTYCASVGDDIEMPTKILFVVDTSDSNFLMATGIGNGTTEGSDRRETGASGLTSQRQRAYMELINHLIPTQADYDATMPSNYHFGLITFNSEVAQMTTRQIRVRDEVGNWRNVSVPRFYNPKFSSTADSDYSALMQPRILGTGGAQNSLTYNSNATNYIGAYEAAANFIKMDIEATENKKLIPRTTYLILFISDGVPDNDAAYELSGWGGNEAYYFLWSEDTAQGLEPLDPESNFTERCITGSGGSPNPPETYHTGFPHFSDARGRYYCRCGYADRDLTGESFNPSSYSSHFFFTPTDEGRFLCVGKYGEALHERLYKPRRDINDNTGISVMGIIDRTINSNGDYEFSKQIHENAFTSVYKPLSVQWHTYFYSVEPLFSKISATQKLARIILSDIAVKGNGSFTDYSSDGTDIDFVDSNLLLRSPVRHYELLSVFIKNKNVSIISDYAVAPDSNGDGVSDFLKDLHGLQQYNRDSDGDGISDIIEIKYLKTNPLLPDHDCTGLLHDEDGDGLNACEERALGTSDTNHDSDFDGIPDGLEVIFGTNPMLYDANDDYDFDGVTNIQEILKNRNPVTPGFKKIKDLNPYSFTMSAFRREDGRNCYRINIKNLDIVKTEDNLNTIVFNALEVPEDDPLSFGRFVSGSITINFNDIAEGVRGNEIRISDFELDYFKAY